MVSSKKQKFEENTKKLEKTCNTISDYIQELYDKDQEWQMASGQISPNHLKNSITKKDKELDEWRELIPGCNTIKSARQFLNRKNIFNTEEVVEELDPSFKSYHENFPGKNNTFETLSEFNAEKQAIMELVLDESRSLENAKSGDFYNMIDFFIFEYENEIDDQIVDVSQIYGRVNT